MDDGWFYVGPNDVFPEQFPQFLGLSPPLRAALMNAHGEIFDVALVARAAGAAARWRGTRTRRPIRTRLRLRLESSRPPRSSAAIARPSATIRATIDAPVSTRSRC